jgi:osmotically-inducible protein OsmY
MDTDKQGDTDEHVDTAGQMGMDRRVDTDKQLFQAVVAEFGKNRFLHYVRVNLHVENGIVTISGRVNSLAERNAVERAARRVAGIKALHLEIRAAAIPVTISTA